MGGSKLKRAKSEEMLLLCTGMQAAGGRVQVRWASESASTLMGQCVLHRVSDADRPAVALAGRLSAVLYESECADQGGGVGHLAAVGTVGPLVLFACDRYSLRRHQSGAVNDAQFPCKFGVDKISGVNFA